MSLANNLKVSRLQFCLLETVAVPLWRTARFKHIPTRHTLRSEKPQEVSKGNIAAAAAAVTFISGEKCHRAGTERDNNTNRWDILQTGATEPWNQTTSSPLKLESISLRWLLCRQTGKSEFTFRSRADLGVLFTDRALASCTKPWVWYQHCTEAKQNHRHHQHHLLQVFSGSEKMHKVAVDNS